MNVDLLVQRARAASDSAEKRAILDQVLALGEADFALWKRDLSKALGMTAGDMAALRPKREKSTKRSPIREHEPWPEEVRLADVLDEARTLLARNVILPDHAADAVALWIAFSHCLEAFDHAPRLSVTSPTMRCGKTTLLELGAEMVARPLSAASATPAVIFRAIEAFHPTLLLDEADTFLTPDKPELVGIVNSGHRRATAVILRTDPDTLEPKAFSTFVPMLVARIGEAPPTIADRSVPIPLRRKAKGERVERVTRRTYGEAWAIGRRFARWAADEGASLENADPELPAALNDRAQDNWRPLVAIADAAGGLWPQRARAAALALSGADDNEEASIAVLLLTDIRDIFAADRDGRDKLATEHILVELMAKDERPWPSWSRGRGLDARGLGKLLRPFGIRSRNIRVGGGQVKGYLLAELRDAFERYIPEGCEDSIRPTVPSGVSDQYSSGDTGTEDPASFGRGTDTIFTKQPRNRGWDAGTDNPPSYDTEASHSPDRVDEGIIL